MRRWLALLARGPALAGAHALAPALLELREVGPQRYEVLWRTPVAQVRGVELAPLLPEGCRALTADAPRRTGEALELRWVAHCPDGIAGRDIDVAGLQGSGVNVVVRIETAAGPPAGALLDAREPRWRIPPASAAARVTPGYFTLGVGHLLTGLDHVLFVLGLLLLVSGWRALVVTVTAFTLGHSLTLAAATLGWLRVNPALAELGIAWSLVAVALAILKPGGALLRRRPALAAAGFGLLHGLGFAGALAGIGLPAPEIPLALLAFNLGIEAGQLLLVAAALALAALARTASWASGPMGARAARVVPAYVIGSLAACWCLERAWIVVG